MGYTGNKGAVATRIVIGETTRLVFVNSHLAAGAEKANLERRNWDAAQIILRSTFGLIDEQDLVSGELNQQFGNEEFGFWFGDLNYRLDDIPGDDVRRLLHLHVQDEFRPAKRKPITGDDGDDKSDVEGARKSFESGTSLASEDGIRLEDNDMEPSEDPASLLNTLSSLLPHDQLQAQQKSGKSFHQGWHEGPITFLPTYKYDVGRIGVFDSSEKQRSPSWCDRILFRTQSDYLKYEKKAKEAEASRKRDEEMKNLGLDKAAEDDDVLFDYDPDQDAAAYNPDEDEVAGNAANNDSQGEDAITLLEYTSHQNIVSSDHKPIHADFEIKLDVVIPSLKAKIHQEVARELDKAENEARPDITMVVDHHSEARRSSSASTDPTSQPDTVNFGKVRYDVPTSRSLTLANTGGVPATFGFHYNPSIDAAGSHSSPPWLQIRVDWPADNASQDENSPKEYTLQPGDSANVRLTLCISNIGFVRDLNEGKAKVDDILVLRVIDGRDQFLSVRGRWLPSSFGFSLEELTRIPEQGVRALNETLHYPREDKSNSRSSGPRELFKLTEAIAEHTERSIAEWEMVSSDASPENTGAPWGPGKKFGWPFSSQSWSLDNASERQKLLVGVREAIDTNSSFSEHFPVDFPWRYRTELLAETLITFLRSLRDGIITERLWAELDQQKLLRDKSRQQEPLSTEQTQSLILETLSSSPSHSVSFTFLTFMLNRIANEIAPITPIPAPTSTTTPEQASTEPPVPTSKELSTPAPSSQPTLLARQPSLSFPFRLRGRNGTLPGSNDGDTSTSAPQTNLSITRREALNDSYTSIFATAMFSSSIPTPEKEKDRRLWEERKKGIIAPFLYVDTS
ncbi:hypothetical protein FQN49_005264 [Arthroderma sp. PD_2]|nr:hypothetical protein FQN49_005264 [Arthroderma sp. PD_2]